MGRKEKPDRPKFSTGAEMGDFHIARREGGTAGLYAHRIRRLAEKTERILIDMKEWKNIEGHRGIFESCFFQLSKAATALEEAQGELTRIPKDWAPRARGKWTPSTDALVRFRTGKDAQLMRGALDLPEGATGRVLKELPNRMLLVQFGDQQPGPMFSKYFEEVSRPGPIASSAPRPVIVPAPTPEQEPKPAKPKINAEALEGLSRDELRTKAKKMKVPGYSKMTAEQLRAAIIAAADARAA